MQDPTATQGFPTLAGHKYMNLTTYRRHGEEVTTPVWFAERRGKLYVWTEARAGKVKRARNNPAVLVAPSSQRGKPLGPPVQGAARILPAWEGPPADELLTRKYGLVKRAFGVYLRLRGKGAAYLEIAPV